MLTENPQQVKAHADALHQLVERIERTMAHARDVQRWLDDDLDVSSICWRQVARAQRCLAEARQAASTAESLLR